MFENPIKYDSPELAVCNFKILTSQNKLKMGVENLFHIDSSFNHDVHIDIKFQ